MRITRTDPDRATAAAILAHSGPREVEAALQDAALTRNKALAAAALSRMDAMDKSARDSIRLSRNDVAAAIVGEESNRARKVLVTRRGTKQRELQHLLREESDDD